MNDTREFDRAVARWLDDGSDVTPPEVIDSVLLAVRSMPQERDLRNLRRTPTMTMFMRAAAVVAIVAVAGVSALYALGQGPNVGFTPAESPTVTASPATATSATAAPATSEPPTTASPSVFTEIAPGEFVEIPDWPLGERTSPPMVWTGAELIVWGDGIYGSAGDGAAFDLANGTWRVIAEAPISPRGEHAAAWTGTEMIVWGGRVENSFYYDGAAYNPVTDTWRLLSRPPAVFAGKDPSMLWTGQEAVVLGVMGDSETYGEYIGAAAYDPVTDNWRSLANAPDQFAVGDGAWWTGDSIVVADVGYDPRFDRIARYDMAAGKWTMLDVGSSAAVVGVPAADGTVSTFVNLPSETGAPTQLIDSTGSLLAELPAFPGDPSVFGEIVGASGLWVGDEAVFEIWNNGPDYQPEQIWALNPSSQLWRRLDADTAFPRIDHSIPVAGDLLLMWNRPNDVYRGTPRVCCVAPPSSGGSIYRISTTSPSEVP